MSDFDRHIYFHIFSVLRAQWASGLYLKLWGTTGDVWQCFCNRTATLAHPFHDNSCPQCDSWTESGILPGGRAWSEDPPPTQKHSAILRVHEISTWNHLKVFKLHSKFVFAVTLSWKACPRVAIRLQKHCHTSPVVSQTFRYKQEAHWGLKTESIWDIYVLVEIWHLEQILDSSF